MLPTLHVSRRLIPGMLLIFVYTTIVMCLIHYLPIQPSPVGNEIAAMLGVVLGILIVFRNNEANARWWEARKHWGQLINDTRNLILKAQAHAEASADEFRQLAGYLAGFAHALRLHLNGAPSNTLVPVLGTPLGSVPHAPGHVAGLVHQMLNRWNRQGKLRDTIWILDPHARALLDICGACERIRNTPLASSYRALLRWGLVGYVLVAPWALGLEMGWWSIPVLVIAMWFLLGIELTAEDVEEPFGPKGDDLPLHRYCQTIESFVFAVTDETQAESINRESKPSDSPRWSDDSPEPAELNEESFGS